MYLYLEPKGGLNDILVIIQQAIDYCMKTNRILLINGIKTHYKINFSDYIIFNDKTIIDDINKIKEICKKNFTIYPEELNDKMSDILDNKLNFNFSKKINNFTYNDNLLDFPDINTKSELIIVVKCGGGNGFKLFEQLKFKSIITNECIKRYSLLKKPYLCIQVRNTDYKCDFEKVYEENKELINKYNEIYISTDDIKVLNFYKEKDLPIKNFTTFPLNNYYNLHVSNIDPHTKFIDLFCDIYIIAMSDILLSNSNGGFIKLVRKCFNNKSKFIEQFE